MDEDLVYIYNGILPSHIKVSFAICNSMDGHPEDIMLNEINQIRKQVLYGFTYVESKILKQRMYKNKTETDSWSQRLN